MGILSALTRRRLLQGAGAATLLPVAAAPIAAPATTPRPVAGATDHLLDLVASVGPGTGDWLPVSGGRFEGERFAGDVLPGGTLRVLTRQDDLRAVELACTLRTRDGQLVGFHGRGLLPVDAARVDEFRAVPEFEAPAGAHDWLNRAVLVARLDASRLREGTVSIRIHRIA